VGAHDRSGDELLGATWNGSGTTFRVGAPGAAAVSVVYGEPEAEHALNRSEDGIWAVTVEDAVPGTSYRVRVDGELYPDPASRFQPEGVHGSSQVIDPGSYVWQNEPPSFPLDKAVIYELHVGTFTGEGTFSAARSQLEYLRDLGVNTIELMPVHDFPGRWNWGYDPAAHFAPSRAYGRPDDLKAFLDAAHALGLKVLLDVVYNHFGPAGAYLPAIMPEVLDETRQTEWGPALAFEGKPGLLVRRFFLENALMWLDEYRFDGLRLDATFAIIDNSEEHWLAQLAREIANLPGEPRWLIAEDPRNMRDLLLPREEGGYSLHGVWADDFHHTVRVRLTGDDFSYFRDFHGTDEEIARTVNRNWLFEGQYSLNSRRPRGTPAAELPAERFVYCIQNHDQTGNRPNGERLHHAVDLPAYCAATALLLFASQTPLLFMGQEWATSAPFLYFTDHEGELGEQVSAGRAREFADFPGQEEVADPQEPSTFERSKLRWEELRQEPHAAVHRYYRDLLQLRNSLPGDRGVAEAMSGGVRVRRGGFELLVAFEGGATAKVVASSTLVLCSESDRYQPTPVPPTVAEGAIRFARPGARIYRVDD